MTLSLAEFLVQREPDNCLTEAMLDIVRAEQTEDGTPVRFEVNGQAVDIVTGQRQPPETPDAARICYFNFSKATAVLIAKETNTHPVFVGTPN